MSFREVNKKYENWLRRQCRVDEDALRQKHKRMKKDSFTFLRATFFRWAGRIEKICPDLAKAPAVLSVGDVHLENFGTWLDAQARLVWGINDFDEAAVIPYPFDLVRLAASARLAPRLAIHRHDMAAMLGGYRRGLTKPRPTLLDERERWMRPFVACSDHERQKFWSEIDDLPDADPPEKAKDVLAASFPGDHTKLRFFSRVAGGGSLGRPRFVASATWQGGRILREAKALVPSGWDWAHSDKPANSRLPELAGGSYRSPDPFLEIRDKWIVRRISADSRKVNIGNDFDPKLAGALFDAMGFDLGAIHAADRQSAKIADDLDSRHRDWLFEAAQSAAAAVDEDYREWCR